MKMLEKWLNTENIYQVLRGAAVLAGLAGTALALWLGLYGGIALMAGITQKDAAVFAVALLGLLTVIVVSICCYAALTVFYRMCGRLSGRSAFTQENVRALEKIAYALAIAGAMITLAYIVLAIILGTAGSVLLMLLLPAILFLGLALIAYALCLLVRRAALLQQENDLTI